MLFNNLSAFEINFKDILHKIRMLAIQIHQLSEVSEILQIKDITQQQIALQERKKLEKSLRLADYSFESIGISAAWIDKNARILRVNDAICQNLGYSPAELESMHIYDLDPNFPQEVWPEHWQKLKQRKHLTFISQHQRKDGSLVPMEITINYVKFDGEEYNFAFGQDISEQQAALRERLQAETALRESEERDRSCINRLTVSENERSLV